MTLSLPCGDSEVTIVSRVMLKYGLLFAAAVTARSQPAPAPDVLKQYQTVTAERLLQPEDGNWLMIRRTYDGWGYSPLDQITPANVARLRPVWGSATGEGRAHESAPVVNNGVLFITTPNNQVIAFNAVTGTMLWRYRRPRPQGAVFLTK